MKTISTSSTIIWAYYLKFNVTNCDNPKGHSSPYEQRFLGKRKFACKLKHSWVMNSEWQQAQLAWEAGVGCCVHYPTLLLRQRVQ